jgi:phosphinothricin acetyltransferase
MKMIDCDESRADEILALLNDAIVHSTALYDYHPRPASAMGDWFAAKRAGRFPIVGLLDDAADRLAGFASYGRFRGWPANKYGVEHSVYVHRDLRGQGLGERLLRALIERAQSQDYHLMVGGVDASNEASRALHRKLGFALSGTIPHAGFKFGRWLDLEFWTLLLPTPTTPVDG